MPNGHYPLLIFPTRTEATRSRLNGGPPRLSLPPIERQRARITPQLAVLQQALEARRLRLQQFAPLENPELVLVFEVVGTVAAFAKAVARVPSLEWLFELVSDATAPDEDFHEADDDTLDSPLSGRLYLLGTNQEALDQLLALWDRYQRDPTAQFDRGLAPFKHVFAQLRVVRPWDATDRVGVDVRSYWQDQVASGQDAVLFEIEAWYSTADGKNEATLLEVQRLVGDLQGRVLSRAVIGPIAYHGLLVELPADAVQRILEGDVPALLLSDRVMFFRPRAQSVAVGANEDQSEVLTPRQARAEGPPVVALLDGLPLANHALLAGRLLIDDPDGWDAMYEAKDRVHGTAMASLLIHGELDAVGEQLARPIYVRPVLRPDPNDGFNQRRTEQTPDEVLLIDLMHRAVRRIFEGENGDEAVAPTVRVINLSLGDATRVFAREMSPWARLIDWLSHRYSVLFVVSAGNDLSTLTLATPRDSLAAMDVPARQRLALAALLEDVTNRRLLAPAESINAITVGGTHSDSSQGAPPPNRFDLFPVHGVSPLSRIGHGYRRAIKPDALLPAGRTLHIEQYVGAAAETRADAVTQRSRPGHRVAVPPLPAGTFDETGYCRGTSNAAALCSRAAAQAHEMLEQLRAQVPNAPPADYDAVLLKALIVHGTSWGDLAPSLVDARPDLSAIANGVQRHKAKKDFVARWIGYGLADVQRAITCTDERATLLGVGELRAEEAVEFSAPLPPGLAGRRAWRRFTVTLAWLSPVNPTHHAYRRARLWVSDVGGELRVKRYNSVDDKAATRGTVQHEVYEGDDALAYVDGATFKCKVNCAEDAGKFEGAIRFALCVSLEVAEGTEIQVYQQIRARIAPAVGIHPA
jgi:hypothetical protein